MDPKRCIFTGLAGSLLSYLDKNAEARYKLALLDHTHKNASTLEFDINTALEYSKRLQKQLEKKMFMSILNTKTKKKLFYNTLPQQKNLHLIYKILEELNKK